MHITADSSISRLAKALAHAAYTMSTTVVGAGVLQDGRTVGSVVALDTEAAAHVADTITGAVSRASFLVDHDLAAI